LIFLHISALQCVLQYVARLDVRPLRNLTTKPVFFYVSALQCVVACCSVLHASVTNLGCQIAQVPTTESSLRITNDLSLYGVASISSIDKITDLLLQNIVSFIGLFCKRNL